MAGLVNNMKKAPADELQQRWLEYLKVAGLDHPLDEGHSVRHATTSEEVLEC